MGCIRCHQIECCIREWSTGTRKESSWKEVDYKANYLSHLNSLLDLHNRGLHQKGRDPLRRIQDDLLKAARHVSLSLSSTLFSDIPLAVTEANTRVPLPILQRGQESSP
jgi:hypothetical protein